MTRIWQNFREPRTAAAILSALLALLVAVLELRSLFSDAVAGTPSSDPVQAGAVAVSLVALTGSIVALRRGNLVFLLVAWAFVLGSKFTSIVRFLEELDGSSSRSNVVLAVLEVNLDLILVLAGATLAFAAWFLRRRPREPRD